MYKFGSRFGKSIIRCSRLSRTSFFPCSRFSTIAENNAAKFAAGKPEFDRFAILGPIAPSDSQSTNPLLSMPIDGGQIDFGAVTPAKCLKAVIKNIVDFQAFMDENEKGIPNDDFDAFYKIMQEKLALLEYSWAVLETLSSVDMRYNFDYSKELALRVLITAQRRFQSMAIEEKMKKWASVAECEYQQAVCDKYLKESRLNGMHLLEEQKPKYMDLMMELNTFQQSFQRNITTSVNRFKLKVTEKSILQRLPNSYLQKFGDADGVNLKLTEEMYKPFMKYCPDREQRWNLWRAYNNRASPLFDLKTSNGIIVDEIRRLRQLLAEMHGFKSYCELSLSTTMAGSIEAVKALINTLHERSKVACDKQLKEMTEYVSSTGEFEGKELELWDISYWKTRLVEHNYPFDEKSIKEYFPLPVVLNGLFSFCKNLFDIDVVEANRSTCSLWHSDARLFDVYTSKGLAGSFLLDSTFRDGKKLDSSIHFILSRADALNLKPVCSVAFSFSPSSSDNPVLLNFDDVVILFKALGLVLQHSLTQVPYYEVSGVNNVEVDRRLFVPEFMKTWVINDYNLLQSCSSHCNTKEKLPLEIFTHLRERHRLDALDLKEELYLSALDVELFSDGHYWRDVAKDVWNTYMKPLPYAGKTDHYVCSFEQIFLRQPATYFSKLWSQMLAADAYLAFKENTSLSESDTKDIGLKFRDTILSLGNGCNGSELFRRFRGRDPSPDSILFVNNLHPEQVKGMKQDQGKLKM